MVNLFILGGWMTHIYQSNKVLFIKIISPIILYPAKAALLTPPLKVGTASFEKVEFGTSKLTGIPGNLHHWTWAQSTILIKVILSSFSFED